MADGQLALQTRVTPPVDDEIVIERDADSSGPRVVWLLLIFTVVAVVMTFPNITRLRSYIPGNRGDALLNLWIVRSVEIAVPQDGTRSGTRRSSIRRRTHWPTATRSSRSRSRIGRCDWCSAMCSRST